MYIDQSPSAAFLSCLLYLTNLVLAYGGVIDQFESVTQPRKYAIVVDAGSSGSRLFVYTWSPKTDKTNGIPGLELYKGKSGLQVVKKLTPGLSSFAENLEGIDGYIPGLLDYAAAEIPEEAHDQTPLYILATAGMRLLTEKQQYSLWNRVRDLVKQKYTFKFDDDHASTISGTQEALYGWIAVNYLSGTFSMDTVESKEIKTHGILDMGGASTQVAFEILAEQDAPEEHVVQFSLKNTSSHQSRAYRIYLVSYLNYGANVMRDRYERAALHVELVMGGTNSTLMIEDPCLSRGEQIIRMIAPRAVTDFRKIGEKEKLYNVSFKGTGDSSACTRAIVPMFQKELDCSPLACAIGQTTQPRIDFARLQFFGLTEFAYALTDVIEDDSYSYDEATRNTKKLCARPWTEYLEELRKKNSNSSDEKHVCFKASYTIAFLHTGLSFPTTYGSVHRGTHLNGTEVQWSLGALFYILNAIPGDNSDTAWFMNILFLFSSILLLCAVALSIAALSILMRRRQREHRRSCYCPAPPGGSNNTGPSDTQSSKMLANADGETIAVTALTPNCACASQQGCGMHPNPTV